MEAIEQLEKAAKLAETSAMGLLKSHVKQYTRSDGTVVQEHEDSRQARQASEAANKGHKDADKHWDSHMEAARKHSHAMKHAALRGDHDSANKHLEQAKHHISESTKKYSGKGDAANRSSDGARAFDHTTDNDMHHRHVGTKKENADKANDFMHRLSQHAHQHAADRHSDISKDTGTHSNIRGVAAGKAKQHQKKADINEAHTSKQ